MKILSLLIKIFILIAIIGVGILVYTTCTGSPLVQRIDKSKPDIEHLHEIATQTHIYYAEQAVPNKDGTVTMVNWYERLNGKWVLHKDEITLPAALKPQLVR